MTKNSIKFRDFFHIIVSMKSVVTSSKIRTVINFYAKAIKRFPKRNFHVYWRFGYHWPNYILSKF